MTQGIWIWNQPFIRTLPGSNEKVAVFLLDTQVSAPHVTGNGPFPLSGCTGIEFLLLFGFVLITLCGAMGSCFRRGSDHRYS